MTTMLNYYIEKRKWIVLPTQKRKKHSFLKKDEIQRCENDIKILKQVWSKIGNSESNFILRTGKCSNVIVFDIDEYKDKKTWKLLKKKFKFLKNTLRATSASGGIHLYLKYNEELDKIKNVKIDNINCDILGSGQNCCLAPSKYLKKNTTLEGKVKWKIQNQEIKEVTKDFIQFLKNLKNNTDEKPINTTTESQIEETKTNTKNEKKLKYIIKNLPKKLANESFLEKGGAWKSGWSETLLLIKHISIITKIDLKKEFLIFCKKSSKFNKKVSELYNQSKLHNKDTNIIILFQSLLKKINNLKWESEEEAIKKECVIGFWEFLKQYDNFNLNGGIYQLSDTIYELIKGDIYTTGEKCEEFWLFNKKTKIFNYIFGFRSITRYLYDIIKPQLDDKKRLLEIEEMSVHFNADEITSKKFENKKKMFKAIIKKLENPSFLKEILFNGIVPKIKIKNYGEFFNKNKDLFPAKNGMVNLKTGKLEERTKEHKCTKLGPIDYDENVDTTFINDVYLGVFDNQKIVDYLQIMKGYTLTGHNNLSICVICHGCGSNFKSLDSEWMKSIMGSELWYTMPENAMRMQGGNNDYLYNAKDARGVVINEAQSKNDWNWEVFKSLSSGGDTISVMAKFKSNIEYIPKYNCWIYTNPLPPFPEDMPINLARRIVFVHFKKIYVDEDNEIDRHYITDYLRKAKLIAKKDVNFKDTLMKHNKEFLKWCVEGSIKYYKNGRKVKIPKILSKKTLEFIKTTETFKSFIKKFYQATGNDKDKVSLEKVLKDYHSDTNNKKITKKLLTNTLLKMNFRIGQGKYKYNDGYSDVKGFGPCFLGHIVFENESDDDQDTKISSSESESEDESHKKKELDNKFNTKVRQINSDSELQDNKFNTKLRQINSDSELQKKIQDNKFNTRGICQINSDSTEDFDQGC